MRMFVYGLLNSRGGHMGVIAPNRKTADKMFIKECGWPDNDPQIPVQAFADDSFAFESEVDENLWPKGENDEGDWRVLIEEKYAQLPWSNDDFACHPGCTSETCSDEFVDVSEATGLVKLMRVETDKPAPKGFAHVRWNDDAFGFWVVKE